MGIACRGKLHFYGANDQGTSCSKPLGSGSTLKKKPNGYQRIREPCLQRTPVGRHYLQKGRRHVVQCLQTSSQSAQPLMPTATHCRPVTPKLYMESMML